MLVVKKEVKTFYTICLSEDDFIKVAHSYFYSGEQHRFAKAFESIGSPDPSNDDIIKFFNNWIVTSNGDTARYIADYYGYDGWENAGYIKHGVLRMVVFNWGAERI